MRYKKSRLSAVFLLGLGMAGIQAQEIIPTIGSNASGISGSISYTIGQVFYKKSTGTNAYSIAEGVQQPYEISVVSGIEQTREINVTCTVSPNPAKDFLTLKVENYDNLNMSYHLYDVNGKLLESNILSGNKSIIPIENLVSVIYFLKVNQGNKELKTFKIIKN